MSLLWQAGRNRAADEGAREAMKPVLLTFALGIVTGAIGLALAVLAGLGLWIAIVRQQGPSDGR